jgi:ankyrin repeat protein
VEVVKILLESGADIDARGDSDNKYTSALGWAVRIIKPNLVSFLLESGANIGSRQEPGGIYKYAVKKYEDSSDYEKIIELLDAYVEKQQKSNMQDNLAEPECPPPHIHAVEPEGRHEEYGVASADVS